MNYYESFFAALDEAIERAGNANRLARLTGIQAQAILRWQKRERSPSLEAIAPLIPFIDWPKRGLQKNDHPALMKPITGNTPAKPVVGDDLVKIPVMFEAGAGAPTDVFDGDPKKWIEVLPRYYNENMRAVEVVGDSMEPTIRKGAIVGVVPFSGDLKEGHVYMCRIPYFGLVVKRVKMDGLDGIKLISDNSLYEPVHVPFVDCENLIVGEVVWEWQKL